MSNSMHILPFRSLDDFLLESARFDIPNFKDTEKWANRVTNNLLYYQTNYFLLSLSIFLFIGLLHPLKMILGIISIIAASGLFFYATQNVPEAVTFKKNHPLYSLLIIIAIGYCMVYVLRSVLIFLIGILLPLTIVFLHASLRLRNFKNKITNRIEMIGLKRTPMGFLLEMMEQMEAMRC